MRIVKKFFLQNIRQFFRDRAAIFWSLVFPLILMSILILIFGSGEDNVTFDVALVNLAEVSGEDTGWSQLEESFKEGGTPEEIDWQRFWQEGQGTDNEEFRGIRQWSEENAPGEGVPAIFPLLVEKVLSDISQGEDGDWLHLHQAENGESSREFLGRERKLLAEGDRDAILVIPADFNENVINNIKNMNDIEGEERDSGGKQPGPGVLTVYRNPERDMSEIAADMLAGIFREFNRQAGVFGGEVAREELTEVVEKEVEAVAGSGFSMTDYLVPGIIVMTFLTTGLSLLGEKISSQRERGILRRYKATPVSSLQYFSGLMLHIILVSLLQVLVVYGVGRFFFGFEKNIFALPVLGYMLYSLVVILALGFMILSLVRSRQAASALIQGIYYPLMFLGGLFFPVTDLPGLLRAIVLVNPVTYLINGLRDVLGVYATPTPGYMNLLVPALWLLAGTVISFRYFSWNPGREE